MPITAALMMDGWVISMASSSAGVTCQPRTLIRSLELGVSGAVHMT